MGYLLLLLLSKVTLLFEDCFRVLAIIVVAVILSSAVVSSEDALSDWKNKINTKPDRKIDNNEASWSGRENF